MTTRPDLWPGLAATFEAAASPPLPLDEWAPKYRHVVGDSPFPGRWNNANAPMALEPMRAVSDRRVDQVTMVAPSQLLKSEFCINVAVYAAAYANSVLFYEPDLPLLKEFIGDRIRPAVYALGDGAIVEAAESRFLKKRDSAIVLRFSGGGKIMGLSPQMKTGKSSHTAPLVVLDELDKMGDPTMITVARSRTTVYGADACIVAAGTPTEDLPGTIWRLWSQGSRGVWKGLCPHCRELTSVGWGRIKFDKDEDGWWLPRTAVLICECCDAIWTEADRQKAIRAGQYVHDDPENKHQSFHVPGPAHLWRTVVRIVEVGAESDRGARQEGTYDDYQLWWNEFAGEPWTGEMRGLSARRLQRTTYSAGARGRNDFGEVDRRTVLITAGSDIGAHAIFTEWVAWGIDPRTGQVLCWGLLYRIMGGTPADSIEDPELWRAWEKAVDGTVWRHAGYRGIASPAQRVLIDSQYRPEIVLEWCEAKYQQQLSDSKPLQVTPYGARILPSKGKSRETGDHPVDLSAGIKKPYRMAPRFPSIVWIETNQVKDAIYESLMRDRRLPEGAPRSTHWPVDREARGYTEAWFREFANEVKVFDRSPRGKISAHWDQKAGQGKDNEAWDCRVYAAAAALVHVWPQSMKSGLLALAVRDASSGKSPWTKDEAEALRQHLADAGGGGYASGGQNVVPLPDGA